MRYIRYSVVGLMYAVCIVMLALAVTWEVMIFTQSKVLGTIAFGSTCIGLFTWVCWPDR